MKLSIVAVFSLGTVFAFGSSVPVAPVARAPATWLSVEDVGTISTVNTKRALERVTCYNAGTKVDRAPSIASIDDFCRSVIGRRVTPGETVACRYEWGGFTILVSGRAINGCSWVIDANCYRLLRKPLDECNTSGENGKQGGYVTDICGEWRYDPGSGGSDW